MSMYRNYENPRELEKQLEDELSRVNQPDYVMDECDYERIEDLRQRINFAWQDEEYDEMCYIDGGICNVRA